MEIEAKQYYKKHDLFMIFSVYLKDRLKEIMGIPVKNFLKFLFDNYGIPAAIQSDNNKEFENELLETYLTAFNVQIIHRGPRKLKAQGQV
ncbi:hypothetical protein CWI38_0221p0050 [Hamiltosporidium tvaerminnensis]|uniref:Integrase catalytic domain-containing protein n=1 Tax=Hamiltosporidium tvaerminnensis TaxID=1176355 RepID=A0A4Q9M299_9MICR|nr:hypothetical protein CWI38_0221p0050 [Hamiltosporidium tvaerminnensis]